MTPTTGAPTLHRTLERAASGRALGGVAAGLAEHLGVSTLVVRLAFAAMTLAGGTGVILYAALWVFVPQRPDEPGSEGHQGLGQLLALGALVLAAVLLLSQAGVVSISASLVPVWAAVLGVALVWRQADEAQRARWRASAGGRRALLRPVAGVGLVLAGGIGFLATRGQLGVARQGLLATALAVVGLGVLTGPFWLRLRADLLAERRERIRSQERAELAAQVHDSVLQTLALIQKAAGDPREVTRLARSQERELRGWLYRPAPDASFTAAVERAAAEVEELHRTPVEVVAVGDCPLDERLGALVAAAREAIVNAAKHSGAGQVQVYAEVEADAVTVFVRDRGTGFDPSTVPADRYGLAQSVIGRMERHGGTAVVRSAPADGTEVRLGVPRG